MIEVYTDGATRKGGQGSCAYVMYVDGQQVDHASEYLGLGVTNNFAEYRGLLLALKDLTCRDIKDVDIFSDSQLVVNQVNGSYKLVEPSLKALCHLAQALKLRGGHRLHHVKGHDGNQGNERADALCNECLDAAGNGDVSRRVDSEDSRG